jgi:hypothetical protein
VQRISAGRVLVGIPEEKKTPTRPRVDERKIIKWILKKWGV